MLDPENCVDGMTRTALTYYKKHTAQIEVTVLVAYILILIFTLNATN